MSIFTRYVPKRDPESVLRLRAILKDPEFAGWYECTLDDSEVLRYAEAMMNTFIGATTKVRLEARPIADLLRRSPLWRWALGKRPPDTAWERLMSEAQRR